MDSSPIDALNDDYLMLKDLCLTLEELDGGFLLCFWIYLTKFKVPATIIRQVHPDVEGNFPLLILNEEKKFMLLPLLFRHNEAHLLQSSGSLTDQPCVAQEEECAMERWIHVGCEVTLNSMRLYINGLVVKECPLLHSSDNDTSQVNLRKLIFLGPDGNKENLQACIHYARLLPVSSSIANHFAESPPLKLTLDSSFISENQEVEEGGDGVWSVVGGKASCRRNFSLDVVLCNALGQSVDREMELVASLVYADNGSPVEKPKDDGEAPLLISYDGVEFPSMERPIKFLHGRASFKLKISQLSSKCDNRLFRVHFHPPNSHKYPFLEVYSHPIRCISRNRNNRVSNHLWRKAAFIGQPLDGLLLSSTDEGSPEILYNKDACFQRFALPESGQFTPAKQAKTEHENDATRNENGLLAGLEEKVENLGEENTPSDTESVHSGNSASEKIADIRNPIPDLSLFKYCLESLHGRCTLLKEIVTSANHEDLLYFGQQVSIYTGCLHHWHQISISKQLLREGNDTWYAISNNSDFAIWKNASTEIEKRFMKISHSANRRLSVQDIELLWEIAECHDNMSRQNFDKLWYWLYPVALALSKDPINALWECTSPRWIEGLITKEEAELSLRNSRGLQKPGTFVLRFPTSRSWPHPDAGSLVVTYIGPDHALHHKLLSLDDRDMTQKPLQDLLLAEPELSHLGRVTRQTQKPRIKT